MKSGIRKLDSKSIGRITPCSSAAHIRGQLSGSSVEIFADGVRAGSIICPSPDNFAVIHTGVVLGAGAKITAKQTLGTDCSILQHSTPITVQTSPTNIGGINFPSPLHVCGESVFVDGVEPGAIVEINVLGSPRGQYEVKKNGFYGQNGDGGFIFLNPQMGNENRLGGKQTACNITSQQSRVQWHQQIM